MIFRYDPKIETFEPITFGHGANRQPSQAGPSQSKPTEQITPAKSSNTAVPNPQTTRLAGQSRYALAEQVVLHSQIIHYARCSQRMTYLDIFGCTLCHCPVCSTCKSQVDSDPVFERRRSCPCCHLLSIFEHLSVLERTSSSLLVQRSLQPGQSGDLEQVSGASGEVRWPPHHRPPDSQGDVPYVCY